MINLVYLLISGRHLHIFQFKNQQIFLIKDINTELIFYLTPSCVMCGGTLYALEKYFVGPNYVRAISLTEPDMDVVVRAYTLFHFRHYSLCEKEESINECFIKPM